MGTWNEWFDALRPHLREEEALRVQTLDRGPYVPPAPLTREALAGLMDHTLLTPEATPAAVETLCQQARSWNTHSVCVNTQYVPLAVDALQGSSVVVAAVVGFPLGAMASAAKAFEAEWAVKAGARELDMVMAIGWLKAGRYPEVLADVRAVRAAAPPPVILKVILETDLLTDDEKGLAALLAVAAGADFVKTSTGFGYGGATVPDVQLLRGVVGRSIGVKASGGIKSYQDAVALVRAGANRLGLSKTGVVLGKGDGDAGSY